MNINNFKYNVEFNECGTNRVFEVVKFLHDRKPEVFGILKRRYNEVKSASKEIIKKFGSYEKREEPQNIKVGRNDPCTCLQNGIKQMSDPWIDDVITRMRASGDEALMDMGQKLRDVRSTNPTIIKKYLDKIDINTGAVTTTQL